ncbi:hypothetical protein B566_EDAN002458 [Ephemera danica]|nr:hypothetical protein B566_EDAN002458 [Ephemera danica]
MSHFTSKIGNFSIIMSYKAFILLLLLSMTSIQLSFASSWYCFYCGWPLSNHCSNDNCLAQASRNFYSGEVTMDATGRNVVFKCRSEFDLEGYPTIACNVCKDLLHHTPPTCKRRVVETRYVEIVHVREPVVTTTSSVRPTLITTMVNLPIQEKQKTSTEDTAIIWGSSIGALLFLVAVVAAGIYVYKKRQQSSSFDDTDLYEYPKNVFMQQNDVPPPVPQKPPPPRMEFAQSATTAQDYLDVLPDADSCPEYSYITEEEKPTKNVMFIGDRGWKTVSDLWRKNTN